MNGLLKEMMTAGIIKLKDILSSCRRVTLCLDGWSKKGLSSSFLGISANFYDVHSHKPQHALLALDKLQHPHTGEMLANSLDKCLTDWGIPEQKIMLIVSDNGANMVKAIRLLRERNQGELEGEIVEEEAEDDYGQEIVDDDGELQNDVTYDGATEVEAYVPLKYRRMGCLAHTIQLVIKQAYDGSYKELLEKTRKLVGKIRKSSVAMEKIVQKCGKVVLTDNTTRWNSTYYMAKRLLDIQVALNLVLAEMKIDTLLMSEWTILEEMVALLEPFTVQTDVLQTDSLSLSNIIPSLLELECHLEQFPHNRPLAEDMLQNLRQRFSPLLQPSDPNFNPLPASACLLDPTCAAVMLGFDQLELREAAKKHIVQEVNNNNLYFASMT